MNKCKWTINRVDELQGTECGVAVDIHHESIMGDDDGFGAVPFKFCPYCRKEIEIVSNAGAKTK